jgi:hypothetical protein
MLGTLLVITGVLWASASRCYYSSRGKSASNFISLIIGGAIVSVVTGAVPAAQTFVLLVIGYVCFVAHARLRTFMLASAMATAAILVAFGMLGPIEWSALQRKYPIESMAERLSYETRAHEPAAAKRADAQTSNEIAKSAIGGGFRTMEPEELDRMYGESLDSRFLKRRAKTLSLIHASYVTQFVNSPGFGVERGIGIDSAERMLSRTSAPLRSLAGKVQPPVPMNVDEASSASSDDLLRVDEQPSRQIEAFLIPQIESVHHNAQLDFANILGYGYIRDRAHVVGFQSHGMTHMPSQHNRGRDLLAEKQQGTWGARTVELVSLLKFDEPRVYLSNNLPQMDDLRAAETRPLDAFEAESLAALRDGATIQAGDFGNHVRMLGAVRAASQCMACHAVEHGALLGAFSYDFGFRRPQEKLVDASSTAGR